MATAVDERRARIYDDLRGMIDGELYFEPLDRAPYAHDASLYEIDPLGVVVPADRGRRRDGRPLRGGERPGDPPARGRDRHRRRQPGARAGRGPEPASAADHRDRARARGGRGRASCPTCSTPSSRRVGRRLEPMPRDGDVTTVGGLIAVDAAGGRSMRYGSTGDQVDRLRVVFAGGEGGRPGLRAVAGVRGGAGRSRRT